MSAFTSRPRRLVSIAVMALVSVQALTGCGSSGHAKGTTSAASAANTNAGLKFAQCMRANGVPNFPDPSGGGIKFQFTPSSGINPGSPSFKAAQAKCRSLLPDGGPGAGHPSAQAKAQMLALAQCMRRHGITSFPDPTTSPPSSPAGYSAVFGRDGVFLAIPRTLDVQSPAFKQAAVTCGFGR